jgi:hypothetical protein
MGLSVQLDPLSAFFLLAMAALAVPVSLYSFGYIRYGAYGQSPIVRSGLLSALLGAPALIFFAGGLGCDRCLQRSPRTRCGAHRLGHAQLRSEWPWTVFLLASRAAGQLRARS